MSNNEAVSAVISVSLIILIVVGISAATSFVILQLVQENRSSQAGMIIDEDPRTGIVTVQYVSSGNSDYVKMKAEHFNYTFTEVGERIQFAGQNLTFLGVQEGHETLFKKYKPTPAVEEKVILPGNFDAIFVPQDSKYSSVEYELTNPYEEEVTIEAIRVDSVRKRTQLSHLENEEETRPDKCSDGGPSPEPLCSLIFIESNINSGNNGWVKKDVGRNLPVLVGNKSYFDNPNKNKGGKENKRGTGGVIEDAWEKPELQAGETLEATFYRFQYSNSGNQINDMRGEVVFVTVFFSNGNVFTYSDTIEKP